MIEYFHADWQSIKTHKIPNWYQQAKFGIFIHWGIYSVPAFAPKSRELGVGEIDETWFCNNPYAEWYANSIRVKAGPTYEHHLKHYGKDFDYDDFLPLWKAEHFNPDEWAQLFAKAGANYVVLTTKHHDGFCLFPSRYTDFNATKLGPKKDLVGELTQAVRRQGMKMGTYYSGIIDWRFSPNPIFTESQNFSNACPTYEYANFAYNQVVELINRYEPDILWNDIGWPKVGEHMLPHLFSHYYNSVTQGVVNDRWNNLHCDFSTKEYQLGESSHQQAWEMCRGMGLSFGYNQTEKDSDYLSAYQLIELLVDVVANNGNLLLNIGPKADGSIAEEQSQRLLAMGEWLSVNGEGIYDTHPLNIETQYQPQDKTGIRCFFTQKADKKFVFVTGLTTGQNQVVLPISLADIQPLSPNTRCQISTSNGQTLITIDYLPNEYVIGFQF